jgi:hypothetical protein
MKNVVIGTALNYGVEQIKNFVLSFRKFNIDDDIILVCNSAQFKTLEDFANKFNLKLENGEDLSKIPIHVVASRFLKYVEILNNNKNYKHILLADIRDVFFQSNPFENLPDNDYLYAFTEDPAVTIEIEKYHISMISRLFGEDELKRFAGKKIICSGTILGTNNKLFDWLNIFAHYLVQIQKANPAICRKMLLDQVIANHIFYFQENGKATEVKNNGDIVGTIGHCITHPNHSGDMKLEDDVIYLDGKIPAIIHQYDRSPELFDHFSKVYSYDN